jgi:hypothetical protein
VIHFLGIFKSSFDTLFSEQKVFADFGMTGLLYIDILGYSERMVTTYQLNKVIIQNITD